MWSSIEGALIATSGLVTLFKIHANGLGVARTCNEGLLVTLMPKGHMGFSAMPGASLKR